MTSRHQPMHVGLENNELWPKRFNVSSPLTINTERTKDRLVSKKFYQFSINRVMKEFLRQNKSSLINSGSLASTKFSELAKNIITKRPWKVTQISPISRYIKTTRSNKTNKSSMKSFKKKTVRRMKDRVKDSAGKNMNLKTTRYNNEYVVF